MSLFLSLTLITKISIFNHTWKNLNSDNMAKKVFICRHAERNDDIPKSAKIPNTIASDEPISHLGHTQAELLTQTILSEIPPGSRVHIVSSPFIRCIQTISKLCESLELPLHLESGFGELFYWQSFTWNPFDHLQYFVDPERFRENYRNVQIIENSHICVPDYPENDKMTAERIARVYEPYIRSREEDVIVICTHYGIMEHIALYMGANADLQFRYTILTTCVYNEGKFEIFKFCLLYTSDAADE